MSTRLMPFWPPKKTAKAPDASSEGALASCRQGAHDVLKLSRRAIRIHTGAGACSGRRQTDTRTSALILGGVRQEERFPAELGELRQGISAWEAEVLVLIDPKPECMLKYLYEVVWKIQPVRRDHPRSDPRHWVDESPAAGMIRTHRKICGDFIGYHPDPKAERSFQQ